MDDKAPRPSGGSGPSGTTFVRMIRKQTPQPRWGGRRYTRARLSLSDVKRRWVSRFGVFFLYCLTFLAVTPLLGIFIYIVNKGIPGLNRDFFVSLPKPVGETGGGMGNAIVGSGILVSLTSIIGVPWGILLGVYLSEYASSRLARWLRQCIDQLSSIPSIVIGLFAYAMIVVWTKHFSAWAGTFALLIILVPIVARTTEEILKLVPQHIREAGLALGIPRWNVTLFIVLKGVRGGVMTGVILGIARIMGETAPLIFTAFNNQYGFSGLNQPTASLPVQLYTYAISPFEEWHQQAWTGALVLVGIVLALNVISRILFKKSEVRRD